MKILLHLFILLITFDSQASELQLTRQQALSLGFKPSSKRVLPTRNEIIPKQSLPWPVTFFDSKHTIGNSMPEYQNYGPEAYYHSGADLRVAKQAPVVAPVSGFLMGNYYSYVTNPLTGEDQKFTKPLIEGGDDLYFEITIRTDDHTSLEFHHVNPRNLPGKISDMILAGGAKVNAGEVLGYTALWPVSRYGERYDHIHYNMISSSGRSMNPEFYSLKLNDEIQPVIKNIFSIYTNKKVEVLDGKLEDIPLELVVSVLDKKGKNIYPLPPVSVEASWGINDKVGWDFSQFLQTSTGSFPDIRDVYVRNLRLSDGRTFATKGDYNNTEFLFRLKLPSSAVSPIVLTVKDANNNITKTTLEIR